MDFPGLYAAIERAKAEIRHDIKNGVVPADVPDFSSLHDFVDANMYGGMCDEGPSSAAESMNHEDWIEWGNALQSYLDDWLKAGRP